MDANAQVLFSRAARPSRQTRAWRSSKEDMSWSWMNLPMTTACTAAAVFFTSRPRAAFTSGIRPDPDWVRDFAPICTRSHDGDDDR